MKKIIIITLLSLLLIGSVTGLVFAKDNSKKVENTQELALEVEGEEKDNETFQDMIRVMEENGFQDEAQAMKSQDYKEIDEFMNNITEEDYARMIEVMEESGYESMVNMMDSVSREEMIQMHNDMGGAEDCH